MAVLLEAISVVIPCYVIEAKFPGGRAGYERAIPNRTFCADGHLTRVGFMHADEVKSFVEELERAGLRLVDQESFADIAIVDQVAGPTRPCRWLRVGTLTETGIRFCELASSPSAPDVLHVPEGWSPNDMRLGAGEDDGLDVVATAGGTQTHRETAPGERSTWDGDPLRAARNRPTRTDLR